VQYDAISNSLSPNTTPQVIWSVLLDRLFSFCVLRHIIGRYEVEDVPDFTRLVWIASCSRCPDYAEEARQPCQSSTLEVRLRRCL
jgi:hypothetical protein